MSFINTPEIKTGFWIGLGVLIAFLVLGMFRTGLYLVTRRKDG